jgi:uncharacterized protein (TIGR02466 family)
MIEILFGKALYKNKINIDTKKIVDSISETRKAEKHNEDISTKKSLYVLNDKKYNKLKRTIQKEIDNYTYNIMKWDTEFAITTSWFTKVDIGESGSMHKHTNSFLSGVLYLHVTPNSGGISFFDDLDSITVPSTEYNNLNSSTYFVHPTDGLILIFPSTTYHSVDINKSDHVRYSLAFNVMPVGVVGIETSDSHMNIKLQ